jgi:hypothetical protein
MADVEPDFEMFEGNTKIIRLTVKDNADPPVVVDITGATVKWKLAKDAKQTGVGDLAKGTGILIEKDTDDGITLTDAVNGKLEVLLEPIDTDGIKPGTYYHEVEMNQSGVISTVYAGYIKILEALIDD